MIAEVVVAVLAVLVVAAIIWARVVSARSATKSVETYERALGVLGQVSKRTESTGFRILPHEETGRAHVGRRVDETGGDAPAARPQARMPGRSQLASSRLPPAGEPKLRFSAPNRPPGQSPETDQQDGDDHLGGGALDAGLDVAARARATHARSRPPGAAEARARGEAYRSPGDRHRQVMVRRAATGATAAVAVVAVVVAVIFLSTGGKNPGKVTTTTTHRGGGGSSTTTSTTTTTTLPTSLKPISVSTSNVAFNVPSGSYTLTFQATSGACWVGIEHTGAGPWLFSQTLDAGQSATYKAAGALVMTLGAPRYIALSVNGLVADLPAGINQPYNVELTPSAG